MRFLLALACPALMVAAPSLSAPRPLDVPPDKGWQHARTKLILMAKLGEFQREGLVDLGQGELDVAATYRTLDQKSIASIYLYRPGLFDLPMWFDRSLVAMSNNKNIALGAPTGLVARFALPGSTALGGMRISYLMAGKPIGATGLAMAPIGDWLVAIRLTSDTMDGAALDSTLTTLIAQIRWPTPKQPPRVASPIQACAKPLKFKRAKVVAPDLGQALLGAALNLAVNEKKKEPANPQDAPTYCSQGQGTADYSVYRPSGQDSSYVVAIGDSGIAASVFPEFSLTGRKGNYSVVLNDHDSSTTTPPSTPFQSPARSSR
ncbi:MAG TPA: hypothetical protein VFK50_04410 [Sphingomicrobium sp.]|nr:hypothetical protein [Sphingomicrobium sp.]